MKQEVLFLQLQLGMLYHRQRAAGALQELLLTLSDCTLYIWMDAFMTQCISTYSVLGLGVVFILSCELARSFHLIRLQSHDKLSFNPL